MTGMTAGGLCGRFAGARAGGSRVVRAVIGKAAFCLAGGCGRLCGSFPPYPPSARRRALACAYTRAALLGEGPNGALLGRGIVGGRVRVSDLPGASPDNRL